ncbi:type II secretion system F family protein [Kineococcus sp. SYSU DK004]|uniref:type II secretion system F family protein n=1 Tax=Kineococcus sp. SYSU DK004 TaxID=3383125 RepID=UPI003D7DBB68
MSAPLWDPAGAALGAAAACGALLVAAHLPVRRSPSLAARVGPYLPRSSQGPAAPGAAGALLARAAALLGELLGSTAVVRARLRVLDPDADVPAHRAAQVLWALAGAGAGAAGAWLLAAGGGPVVAAAALVVSATLAGALARDRWLLAAVQRRRAAVVEELPVVAELLALSVGAGENLLGAVARVAAGSGALCADLRHALARAGTGTPLVDALQDTASRLGVDPLVRLVDAVAAAAERGGPLAGVLRAQAADARDAERRRLLEAGGRKEVQMLVPVVFLVLPTVVVFALFPGLAVLRVGP